MSISKTAASTCSASAMQGCRQVVQAVPVHLAGDRSRAWPLKFEVRRLRVRFKFEVKGLKVSSLKFEGFEFEV